MENQKGEQTQNVGQAGILLLWMVNGFVCLAALRLVLGVCQAHAQ